MRELSKHLKKLRGNRSVRHVAQKTGVSTAYICLLENNKRDHPHPEILKKLAAFYGIPVMEFFKIAGYLDEKSRSKEILPEKIDRLFQYVKNNPKFQYGHRIKGIVTHDVKRFVIEMYEEATGESLVT